MKVSETGIPGVWKRHYPNGRERFGWTAVYGGRTYRRISKRNTLRGTVAEREKALARLAAGLPVDERREAPPYTVSQAAADYLSACEMLRSYSALKRYKSALAAHFGDLPVGHLSQVAIAAYRRKRTEAKLGPATINRELSFLRASLNHAKAQRRLEGDHYFRNLSRAERRKVFAEEPATAGIRRVSDDQILSVLAKLPEPYRPVVRLLLATGARESEILGLRWSEVRGGSLFLRRTKSGKPRWVPLTKEAEQLLPEKPKDAEDDALVFRGKRDGEIGNNFQRAWRKARTDADPPLPWLRVHDLRHEAASRFLEAGGGLRELQVLGGWSSLELVERYAKATQERIREALGRVPQPSPECTVSARADGAEIRAFAK